MPVQRRAIWHFFNYVHRLPKGSLVIDCGANVGDVTSAFVRGGFRVHAFEPDPYARALLEQRYGSNPLVTIHPQAVGTEGGTMTLYRTTEFASRPIKATKSSSLFRRKTHSEVNALDVEVIDLSTFINGLNSHVALLKLDVEGAEVAIVERLIEDTTYTRIGMVYAETHERHSTELAERTMRLRQRIADEGIDNINLDWR